MIQMQLLSLHIYAVILCTFFRISTCNAFYREKPDFVKTCKISQHNFNKCFSKSMGNAYRQIFFGIPGVFERSGPLDPLYLDSVKFNETNNLAVLEGELSNISLTGLVNSTFDQYRINTTTLVGFSKLRIPLCRLDADYRLNGRVLLLPFNSNGVMYCISHDVVVLIKSYKHLYKKEGFIFLNATHMQVSLDAAKMEVHYDNILPNEEVSEIFNELINDNWRKIFEAVRPIIENILSPIYLDIFHAIFDLIPITFFIEDIPTRGALYKNNE